MKSRFRLFIKIIIPVLTVVSLGGAGESFTRKIVFRNNEIAAIPDYKVPERPKIGLVFSGGGARGVAHIGVLRTLEEYQIPVDLIVGTSIGSVIGGLYASGYSTDQITGVIKNIEWEDIYKDETQRISLYFGRKSEQDRYLVPIRFEGLTPYIPSAYSPGQRVLTKLSDLFLKARIQARNNFDNLKIPFRPVCTDLVSGKQIVLSEGNLAEAINASLAIPLLFSPVPRDSMLLVDGGLKSNLPVDVAKNLGMDIVIAVDITSYLRNEGEIQAPWEIVDQATTIMGELSLETQRKNADVLIQPEIDEISNTDFRKVDQLVQIGKQAAEKKIPAIEKLLHQNNSADQEKYRVHEVHYENLPMLPLSVYNRRRVKSGQLVSKRALLHDLDLFVDCGEFQEVKLVIDSSRASYSVDYLVEPFPQIERMQISGNINISRNELKKLMITKAGGRLNINRLRRDLENIVELYRQNGYSLMRIENLEWDHEIHTLHIYIDEGWVHEIVVQGNSLTKDYVILRDFRGIEGRVFNWKRIQQAVRNVYTTQLFERVSVNLIEDNGSNKLFVKVQEKSPELLQLGGKFDTDRRAQAYIELGYENTFGMGIKTSILNRFGTRDGHIGVKIRDDRIFTTYLTYSLQGYYNWEVNPIDRADFSFNNYREERLGFSFQIGQQLRRIGQLTAEIRLEQVEDEGAYGDFKFRETADLRTFTLRAITDKRDRIAFPTEGIYNYWSWESGNSLFLADEESYTKAQVNLEGYYTFSQLHTWHLKLFFGIGDRTLPFSENFRLGGVNQFYGLNKNERYGRQLFLGSAEYRFRIPVDLWKNNFLIKNSYLSVRYDLGGLWENPELLFAIDDFFYGLGGYIAFDTLLGPMYFSYGRTSLGQSLGYFSLGFDF